MTFVFGQELAPLPLMAIVAGLMAAALVAKAGYTYAAVKSAARRGQDVGHASCAVVAERQTEKAAGSAA